MGYYGNRMFLGGGGFNIFELLFLSFLFFAFIDAVLLAFWLWKQLKKK